MSLSDKDMETVKDDDEGEEHECNVGKIGLEWRFENKRVSVNSLRLKCIVESDISDAD